MAKEIRKKPGREEMGKWIKMRQERGKKRVKRLKYVLNLELTFRRKSY